jgi:hypothetical protein
MSTPVPFGFGLVVEIDVAVAVVVAVDERDVDQVRPSMGSNRLKIGQGARAEAVVGRSRRPERQSESPEWGQGGESAR